MMKENIEQIAQPTAGFFAKIPSSDLSGNPRRRMLNKSEMATPRKLSDQFALQPGAPFL